MIPHQDRFLDISGLRYHLDVWDGGGSTTVLLLHGFLDLGRTWTATVEALGPCDLHLVAPDWRGHGQTGWVGAGGYYHFADYVRDLEQIVGAVRRERLVVVGHSLGGGVTVLFCGTRVDAADGALLVDWPGPVPLTADAYPDLMATFLDQTAPFDRSRYDKPMRDLTHAATRLRRLNPRLSEADAERYAGWATRRDGEVLRWRYDPLHRTRAPVPMPEAVAAAFYARVSCPMRWVGGAESLVRSPRLDAFLDTREDVSRSLLPGAGHMVQNDQPEALARELLAFVGSL